MECASDVGSPPGSESAETGIPPKGADSGGEAGISLEFWVPVGIFCLAVIVRLCYLAEIPRNPSWEQTSIDAQAYHWRALAFAQGGWPGELPFFWPPLYPLFLGVLYKVIGPGLGGVQIIQAVLGSISCTLVYFMARLLFGGWFVPVAGAVICCLCGPLVLFDSQLLPSTLDVLLQLLAVLLLLIAGRRGHAGWWALAGIALGLCAINRGGILLLVPVILFWQFALARWHWAPEPGAGHPPHRRPSWRAAPALVLPVVLLIAPVSWHNARYDANGAVGLEASARQSMQPGTGSIAETVAGIASGRFTLLAGNVGINLLLGNQPDTYHLNNPNHPRCLSHYQGILNEPARRGITSMSGQSRYCAAAAWQAISSAPTEFLKLMALKALQLLGGDEIPRNFNPYAFRQHSFLLRALLWKRIIAFPSGVIIPLGLVGIYLARRKWRWHFPVLALLAVQCIFALTFFVTARYRLPSVALLAVYGAFALRTFWQVVRRRDYRRATVPAVLLAALLFVCNAGIGPMYPYHGAYEHVNMGSLFFRKRMLGPALAHFRMAVRLSPEKPEAQRNLARVLAVGGETTQAIEHFTKSLELEPDDADVHHSLASVLGLRGETEQALVHFAESLRLEPDNARFHCGFAHALAEEGRLEEAVSHFEEALRLEPELGPAHYELGRILERMGRSEAARVHLEEARRLQRERSRRPKP